MDILDKFIEQAKDNVERGYYNVGEAVSTQRISLKKKLSSQEFSLIAEIKHASPAEEYSFDFIDGEKTARVFKESGADAISVVVEPKIFKGELTNIPAAKKAGLPVLFKDFVLDEKQILAASKLGADSILLVVKVADRTGTDLNSMIEYAHSLGLEVLLECYDENEMKRAMKTNADILGVNNRDLQTLKVDLNHTARVMGCFQSEELKGRPVISESGIKCRADVDFVKAAGIKGVLVGTAIWKSANISEKIRELKLGGQNVG